VSDIELRIEHLVLDNDNPRITHADGQQQALQKVIRDQKTKLVRLAESIVERGLSPIDRLMVLEVNPSPKRYIALEGNRRIASLRLLANPAAMTGLDMPNGMQRTIERLANIFDKSKIEPIQAVEVNSRDEGRYWIELRHNGEDQGRGVVNWKPIVAARFRKKEPAIQAFDMVLDHGGFSEDDAERLRTGFSLTTLRRLMESKDVRTELGLTVEKGQLCTVLPGNELIKPLKKIIHDIANKAVDSRSFNTTDKMVDYVRGFGKADRPDFTKKVRGRPVEGIQKGEFAKASSAKVGRKKRAALSARREVIPKNCPVNVTNARIAEIYQELCSLRLDKSRNAIAVLMRVFLEMSVDHFLEDNGVSLKFMPPKGSRELWKTLDKKLAEVVSMLISMNIPKAHFAALMRDLGVATSPMNTDLFHLYVHDRFATPSPGELTAAWDHAQPLFEKIWP
jgi:hypothetical protein